MTKREEKILLLRFQERLRMIRDHNSVNPNESKAEQKKRIAQGKKDYKFFVETYFRHLATEECPDFIIKEANTILKNKRDFAAEEMARGHGKSVHFDIFIPLWLWINGENHLTVVASATYNAAKVLLSDLQAEFESNPLLKHDFGAQLKHGDWAEGEFKTKDGCAFYARGRGQKLRGLRNGRWRVQYFVFDDGDDDEQSRNPKRVRDTIDWIKKAAINTGDIGIFRFYIVNNRIAPLTVLVHFAEQPGWRHTKVNALDKDGNPTWHQKYTKEHFLNLEKVIGYLAFQTEYMNNPIVEGRIFKHEYFQYKKMNKLSDYDAIVGYWDESYTANKNSDFNAAVIVGRKGNEEHVLDVFCRQCQMKEVIKWMYDRDAYYKSKGALISWYRERLPIEEPVEMALREVADWAGHYLTIIKDDKPKGNKFQRMINMVFFFQRLSIWFNKAHKDSYDMQTLVSQTMAIEEGYKGHDDGPDALQGAMDKLNRMTKASNSEIMLGQRSRPGSRYIV